MAAPTIEIPGTVRPWQVDLSQGGPPQNTKTDRGVVAVDPFSGRPLDPVGDSKSWGEFTGFRDDTPYGVRTTAEISRGSNPNALPPSLYGDMSAYSGDSGSVARNYDANSGYSDPLTAIDRATIPSNGMGASWAPPWAKGVNPDMRWENAQVGTAPSTGDRWGRLRIDGNATEPNRPGLVTGAAPRAGVNPQVQSVMAAQPGQTFLEARGVSTAGLNQSQVANELMKQMAGSSRNADGTRGFGV